MADEALACFTSVLENVPGWIADLEGILQSTTKTQEDLSLANQPSAIVTALSKTHAKLKSWSMRSSRSKDEEEAKSEDKTEGISDTSDPANLLPPLPPLSPLMWQEPKQITPSDALRLSQRKRKTTSVYSGDASGPVKIRSRTAAAVYYDGEAQKHFEKLVRAVGYSRNSIRKGKMSAQVDSLTRTGSSSSETSGNSGEEVDDLSHITANLHYKSTRPGRLVAFGRNDHAEIFDQLDAHLEKGQTLCERAAHQILREGDCSAEVEEAKKHFADAKQMAREELPALQKRAERAAERKRRSEERRRIEEEAAEQRRKSASQLSEKILSAMAAASLPTDRRFETDALEVDDASDDDDDDFNLAAMQFTKFAQMRSARLAAH